MGSTGLAVPPNESVSTLYSAIAEADDLSSPPGSEQFNGDERRDDCRREICDSAIPGGFAIVRSPITVRMVPPPHNDSYRRQHDEHT